jgi:hypothetical protein
MRLFCLIASVVLTALCAYFAVLRPADAARAGRQVVLRPGDVVQLSGAPLGCRFIVPKGLETLDCRVAGSLAGSYGTLMTAKRVQIVRFRDAQVAKVVFVATQHGGFRTCR